MTSMPQDFKKNFKDFWIILVLLVPFEILSNYLNIDITNWNREDVQWIIEKVFREKRMV